MVFEFLQVFSILLFSVCMHECAHGWVAYKRGDPTAKLAGRLTLNPIKHIDPVGTILVPLILKLLPVNFMFGWAKAVPVNFARLKNPRRDMIWVALAGPVTNLMLAFLFGRAFALDLPRGVEVLLAYGVFINLVLAIFNLVPIPPLDGSRIVMGLLPVKAAQLYGRLEPYGFIILVVLLNFGLLKLIFPLIETLAVALGVDAKFV